jgi:hypothetical protein
MVNHYDSELATAVYSVLVDLNPNPMANPHGLELAVAAHSVLVVLDKSVYHGQLFSYRNCTS